MRIDRRFPPTWSSAKEWLYLAEWAAVARIEPKADRRALHVKALGYNASYRDFTDLEFGRVLEVFRAISRPADLLSAIEEADRQKRFASFSIRRAATKLNITVVITDQQPLTELESIRRELSRQLSERKRAAIELKAAA